MLETMRPGGLGSGRRLSATGPSTPERLARVAAVIVVGLVIATMVSLAGGLGRTGALADAQDRAATLTADAAALYSSLADADATATSGYVAGGVDPPPVRARYDAAIEAATAALADAAGRLDPGNAQIAAITSGLPVYTGTVETARTYNRQGLPIGRTYLAEGSTLMRETILPAAASLRSAGTARLADDLDRGGGFGFAVLLLGAGVLVALADLSVREARRTRRTVSPGLVAAAALVVAGLLWWVVATSVAGVAAGRAQDARAAVGALDDARATVLAARSAEGLDLVARSGNGGREVTDRLDDLLAPSGPLAAASSHGADVSGIGAAALAWQQAHEQVRADDDAGRYTDAAASVSGATLGGSGARFTVLDAALTTAIEDRRAAFTGALGEARGAQTALTPGATALFVLAGVAVVVALSRRIGEYR